MTVANLLVELFVEELPPKALKSLGEAFAAGVFDSLKAQGLLAAESVAKAFASPRRLAVHVTQVASQAPDKPVAQKLMPVSVALDDSGAPTSALLKKLAALGLDASVVPKLRRTVEGKAEVLFHDTVVKGVQLKEGLQKAVEYALDRLPIPKVMSYPLRDGWTTVRFVRPAHGLVALHGSEVVPVSVLGLTSGRTTHGHRFEAKATPIVLRDADGYETQLESEGAVIPSFEKRRAEIVRQIHAVTGRLGEMRAVEDAELLDEVTALVERPNVLVGRFDPEFLSVPQECLILTMKANQKYFPLLDAQGRLTDRFLIVANMAPANPSKVIAGNERVVRPRLADAKFFFDQDRKKPLAACVERLGQVVYHNRLGSQLERVKRITKLTGEIARALKAPVELAERAAWLAKADLVTEMVGEFPELQGVMGRYYALHDGEDPIVADAIEAHYRPRFAGDALPEGNVALALALADRLDTLVGIFGIGLTPTGDKDPFALRRAALGVLRMLLERQLPLDLMELLEKARAQFDPEQIADSVTVDVFQFMLERLRVYLKDQGWAADEVEAVVAQNPTRIDRVLARLAAVAEFRRLAEAEALAAANKRIRNILRKAGEAGGRVNAALIEAGAERALYEALLAVRPTVETALENLDYTYALKALAGLREAVDRFFDEVMVMVDEPVLRANRLALLAELAQTMNCVADIGELSRPTAA